MATANIEQAASQKLSPQDLYSLEEYARVRSDFRARVMTHKKNRRIELGSNAALHFESRLTMQYQIQEMLRIERIAEPEGIDEELAVYNPLIPDGTNWKATFMIEYPDIEERRAALQRLTGIEDRVWVQVAGFQRVYAIADEDLERADETKTSAVHFLRFEPSPEMARAAKEGAAIGVGIDHEHYRFAVETIAPAARGALLQDLNG